MPFWLLALIMFTLILLCWGGGYGFWNGVPGYGRGVGGILGAIGLIFFIILVMMFVGAIPSGGPVESIRPARQY